MLTALLDSIRSQFGSKSYWLGSMMPLILFLAANASMAYPHCAWIGTLLTQADTWDQKTFRYSVALLILLALAYFLSTLSSVLLRMLEGRIGPLSLCSSWLCRAQWKKLRGLDRQYEEAVDARETVRKAKDVWKATLQSSRRAGREQPSLAPEDQKSWSAKPVGMKIDKIRRLQSGCHNLTFDTLDQAVALLAVELAAHRTGRTGVLADALTDLQFAIQYAMDRREFDIRHLLQRRQVNYPGIRPLAEDQPEGPVANNILAPTTMGNIGRTIGTYSLARYYMDLDIFWTRLQNSLQKDAKDYYAVLQDSKVQVDTMGALFWLSVVFTLVWTATLCFVFRDATAWQFLTAGTVGTVCAIIFYLLACESYRVFADVMRSAVDLFRFQVLQALHLSIPADSNDEKALWLRLGGATGFLDVEDFQYKQSMT